MLFSRTPGRRSLRFERLGDILEDIERSAAGHRGLGNWTLPQICHHLADTQEYSVSPGEAEIRTTRLYRATIGRFALRMLLWFGYIPEGQGRLNSPPGTDLDAATDRLRRTIDRVSTEPMIARHPIFGRLSQEQWRQFHLHHAAHHLSFVIPEVGDGYAEPGPTPHGVNGGRAEAGR